MWTEVTKDLVTREAIEEMGYQYEEAENHFYVVEYLQYVRFCFARMLRIVILMPRFRRMY